VIVAMVFFAIMLNYVDRQILALLKPTLEAEFRWSDQDYANMVSAFQISAAFAFLGTGWFIDRVGLRLGFALGVAVWSIAGMAHAFATGVVGFIVARIILGAAESIGTPAAVKSAATYFNQKDRSIALGVVNTAPNIGAIVTPLVIPLLAVALGWRAAFLIAGGLGLVWVAVWFAVRVQPVAIEGEAPASIAWTTLLRDRKTLALAIAKVLSDQVWFFMLSWLPDLFHRLFGLPQGTIGLPVALVYVFAALGALTGGWLPTWLMTQGWSVDRARREPAYVTTATLCAPLQTLLDVRWVVGVRNSGHTVAKMMNPVAGSRCLRLASFTHPEFGQLMAAWARQQRVDCQLLRGTEGEPVADPRRQPRIDGWIDGACRAELSLPAFDGVLSELPLLPRKHDAATTALYIQEVLSGERPAPQPLLRQVALVHSAMAAIGAGGPASVGLTA
jgi:ACS family hexuronate transporter-like MFS transporter